MSHVMPEIVNVAVLGDDFEDDTILLRHTFVRALHPNGFSDLRAIQAGKIMTSSVPAGEPAQIDAFATQYHDHNVYIGVAARARLHGRELKDCLSLHALFADIDLKDFESEAAARARLRAFPLPPSFIIASGGGLHCYWLLETPIDLQHDGATRAKQLLRVLAEVLGADLKSAEPVHILRLPGTLNLKYPEPRPVTFEQFEPTRRYRLDELVAVLPAPTESSTKSEPLPTAIREGGRNDTLFKEGCRLRRLGFDLPEILAALTAINQRRCQPPLPTTEVETIANSCARYEPADSTATPEPGSLPAAPVAPPPYNFTPAFPAGHFVTTWIDTFSKQCDAALEYHEACALVALSVATPSLSARISGAAEGLRTNLYVLLVGDAGRTRKSTAKNYAISVLKRTLPNTLLPEQMTQESMVESLTLCNGSAACWPVDEFTDTLAKLTTSTYLAGMRGLVLEMYGSTDYTYRRVSKKPKKRKDDEDEPEREEDAFAVKNVTFSILGCATPTIFRSLDNIAVGSGLLTRFAVVMPESKPARIPQFELSDTEAIPSSFVQWLKEISVRSAGQAVTFAPGALRRIDEAVDRPLDEAADRYQMTVRSGVMARKIAMLSAAGRAREFDLTGGPLVVTLADAESAICVTRRWIEYAKAFEARTEETSFEVQLQKCAALVRGRTVSRREIARRVHVSAKTLKEIEDTLVARGLIEVLTHQSLTGRPSFSWRAS
jgi:hypothetical protein